MQFLAELVPATGYRVYAGADISAVLDAEHKIIWACTAFLPKDKYNGVQANVIFIQVAGQPTQAIIPLNPNQTPLINARGSISGMGTPLYVGWDKTIDTSPKAYAYFVPEIVTPVLGASNFTPLELPIPGPRYTTPDENDWVVTDELIRDKFNLDAILLNAIRNVLIAHKLAK